MFSCVREVLELGLFNLIRGLIADARVPTMFVVTIHVAADHTLCIVKTIETASHDALSFYPAERNSAVVLSKANIDGYLK